MAEAGPSSADKMRLQHEQARPHPVEIQEVPDEDDVQHPPPSAKINGHRSPPAGLNPDSVEAFPALGGGSKKMKGPVNGATLSPSPSMWGLKKPNGTATAPSPPVSASTLSSSTAPVPGGSPTPPAAMSLPGRHRERVQFAPSQLLPRAQLKKPLADTLRDLNRKSKARIEMKPGPAGSVIFEGAGPVDATRQALKELAHQVGSKQQIKIPVPVSVRPHVLGRNGATIQGISSRTGARVQLPKPTGSEDDDTSIDIAIEGDAVAAEMARQEIEAIVNERTSSVNLRLRNIPAELLPFIAGPYNVAANAIAETHKVRLTVPHYHTWSNQPPPTSSSQEPVGFPPSEHTHIQISGDRLAAQHAREEIERIHEALRHQITLSQVSIDRGRHQFILEDKDSLHEFLASTGCAIILPPSSADTEVLTVTGPRTRIDAGIDRVMDLASAMYMSRVDIARQHASGSPNHARALTRYLQQRQAIQHLEKQFEARIALPANAQSSPDWEVYVKDPRMGMKAKQEILNVINAHPPSRIRHVEVDPFFHEFVRARSAERLRREYGVHLLAGNEGEPLVMVYEGPESKSYQMPAQVPSPSEVAVFEKSLREAQKHVLELISGQENIDLATVEIPAKYQDKVQKHVSRQQLPSHEIPPQLSFTRMEGTNALCQVRGPSNKLPALTSEIRAFVEQEKRDEQERDHVTTFDFPHKHMNFLIGRRGEHVNALREEFDLDIQTKDGAVSLVGPPNKAQLAKTKILALAKKLEDESSHTIRIPAAYHREIIGAKGVQIHRLQDRYGVHIQFPRAASAEDDPEHRARRTPQGPDEVIVKGPSKGASSARDELLSLLQWTIDNSHTAQVSIAQRQLPKIIGAGGQELDNLRISTGAQIDVPPKDAGDASGRVQVVIKGTKKQMEEARKILQAKAVAFDDVMSREIDVDPRYHKALIGPQGSNIRQIVLDAGGLDDRREIAQTVRVPRPESGASTIRVEGPKAVVTKILATIQAFIQDRQGETTIDVDVPAEKHRVVIGRGGDTKRSIENRFKVTVVVPRMDDSTTRSSIQVTGQASNIEAARTHIMSLVTDLPSETIHVPLRHHHRLADNGQFFRRLRSDHKTSVDHDGNTPPSRPKRVEKSTPTVLPLITDNPDAFTAHSFHLAHEPVEDVSGTIPWVLKGPADRVAGARALIEKSLQQAEKQTPLHVGSLVLPDPSKYRFIVGPGGAKINEVRAQTQCKITIPRDQTPGAAIEIVGSEAGVLAARDAMLQLAQSGGRRD